MKYFRSYPYMLQLLLFILMVFTLFSFGSLFIPAVVLKITNFTPQQLMGVTLASPPALVNALEWVDGVSNLFIFGTTAALFAYLATPRPASYLGLRKPGKNIHLLLAVLIMIGASPVLAALGDLIGKINFGAQIKADQKANDDMMAAIMNITSFGAFLKIFTLFAIVPGIGEELFFRGVLMRFAKKRSLNMVFPVLFVAAVFAYAHTNIYGMLSIFIAGILLAVIYNLTGSIWCSILGHLSFNGLQVLLSYLGHTNAGIRALMENNSTPLIVVAGGAVLFGISFYLLWKNRTPLPPNWADDYTPQEISAKAY